MRDKIAEIIRNARMNANPLAQVGYAEADALISNGVILPPVKVGQIVWMIDDEGYEGTEPYALDNIVTAIGYDIGGFWITIASNTVDLPIDKRLSVPIRERSFGKWVFLTKEEAEKCLKEKGNENNA